LAAFEILAAALNPHSPYADAALAIVAAQTHL
jgi:hypothetical protein